MKDVQVDDGCQGEGDPAEVAECYEGAEEEPVVAVVC